MSDDAREAADRLREAGLGELLDGARRRIEINDGLVGTVVIQLDRSVLLALAHLVGWRRLGTSSSGRIRLSLVELDRTLRQSRFAVGLLDVLEADGGPVITRRQRWAQAETAWAEQLRRIAAGVPATAPAADLVAALSQDGPCARWYRRAYREDAAAARETPVGPCRRGPPTGGHGPVHGGRR